MIQASQFKRMPHRFSLKAISLASVALCMAAWPVQAAETASKRPNIVLILVDDMGFSDISCFGGSIPTPNIDAIAAEGMRFTNFYAQPVCAPTRAALISGLYPQKAGVGVNIAKLDDPFWTKIPSPAYQSFRSQDTVTIAEVLRAGGYRTYMTGKWHLGDEPERWPVHRGFDRSFALVWGATDSNEKPVWAPYCLDDKRFTDFPDDFYVTDAFTERAIEFIREGEPDKPFFLFLSYNAPHLPHGAPTSSVQRVKGHLELDPVKERQRRFARQKELGLFGPDVELGRPLEVSGSWEKESPETLRERFETYAAMIDRVDEQVGNLVAELKRLGRYDDTLLVFLSDNGCVYPGFGVPWAEASNTPFRLMKGSSHEGGIRVPFIVRWPGQTPADTINHKQVGHVMDLLPTFAEAAGIEIPATYEGRTLQPIDGVSILNSFRNPDHGGSRTLFWEMACAGAAVRDGNWKLVRVQPDVYGEFPVGPQSGDWELYDLSVDPTENHDLAAKYPERVKEMAERHAAWEKQCNVLPWQTISSELAKFRAEEKAKESSRN